MSNSDVEKAVGKRWWRWLSRSLELQLMLLTAVSLLVSILGYGAYIAKRQTDVARETISAQMTALAKNLATVNAHFLVTKDLESIESIALQTATVPGIFSLLVTDPSGNPMSEVVNKQGRWSPRYSRSLARVPTAREPRFEIEVAPTRADSRDFLAGSAGVMSAWHPIVNPANQGDSLGWVRVSYRLDSFDQLSQDIWTQALIVMGVAIALSLSLLAYLLRRPMRALRLATRFANELDQSKGTQMAVTQSSSEIQALGQALNSVSTRLFDQSQDLTNQKFALDQHAIVSITDLSGTIVYANDRFCAISGYSRSELLGSNHRIVKLGEPNADVFSDLWRTIAQGKVWHGEFKNRARDGHAYWVDATVVPMLDGVGRPHSYIAICTDITSSKTWQESLQAAKQLAESANQAKSEFLANMSHEIRTPMNGILGMTDLLLETPLNDNQHNYLNAVKSSAQSLLVILNGILDFSKIESGKMVLESVDFDLRREIRAILASLEPRAHSKGLTLTCSMGDELPDCVVGDPGRIRQILVNLCDNAIKFTAQGGIEVTVQSREVDEAHCELEIAVKDSGIGIARDKHDLIFSPFAQADSSTTRRYGGTGLGLTISARLAALMGGRLWVDSDLAKGSTFHFTVRVTRPNAAKHPGVSGEAFPAAAGASLALDPPGRLVLLVEDHPVNQLLVTTILKKAGHRVVLAQNGQEAVDLFPTAHWDIVLMDMQMPVMGGLEATRRIRDLEVGVARTPIIAVTANAMEADRKSCLEAGMDDHLAKPISAQALLKMLERYSSHPRSPES